MKIGYTEFSYGYAFTENLIRSSVQGPTAAPYFPNLVQEAQLGYDIRIDLPAYPLFFQFKLPEIMVRDTAKEIKNYQIPGLLCNFFRMPLMRRDLSDQHQHMIDLEQRHPGLVYYASPMMENIDEFNSAYNQGNTHRESVFFSPNDIGPLPDDKSHVVSYMANANIAWRCSEPLQVKGFSYDDIYAAIRHQLNDKSPNLEQIAPSLLSEMRDRTDGEIEIDQPALRARIRERMALPERTRALDERTLEVTEQLLAAREIARIGLGIEMVIAQPRA